MYLVCDRDGICGSEMSHCLDTLMQLYAIADSLVEQDRAASPRKRGKFLHRVLRDEPDAGRGTEALYVRRPDLRGSGELRPERVHRRPPPALPLGGDRASC